MSAETRKEDWADLAAASPREGEEEFEELASTNDAASALETRNIASRITGPPAPCADDDPTSSWSNSATALTAVSLLRRSAPPGLFSPKASTSAAVAQ